MRRTGESSFVAVFVVLLALGLIYSLTHILNLSQNAELANQNHTTELQLDHLENELSFQQSEFQSVLLPTPRAVVAQQSPVATDASRTPPEGEQAGIVDLNEDLHAQLQDVRAQKQNILTQSRQSEFNQSSSQKLEFDQLTAQIALETQKIGALTQEMVQAEQAYAANQFDLDSATRAHDLSLAIEQENAVLQGMRDQRDADNAQWSYQIGADRFHAQQEIQELSSQEQELTNQLASPTPR